jgi:hypothetical protein
VPGRPPCCLCTPCPRPAHRHPGHRLDAADNPTARRDAWCPRPPNLGTGPLLVILLGAPFLIWRSITAQRTVDLGAEALLNDTLNADATDLAARWQVTGSVEQVDQAVILTKWQDHL